MIVINEEKFPMIYANIDGAETVEDMEMFLSCFNKWLSRDEKFGVIFNQRNAMAAAGKSSKEVAKMETKWVRQNKLRIAERCLGIAVVPDSEILVNKWRPSAAKTIKNKFGCSGQVFSTLADAENWIKEQIYHPTSRLVPD
jgi:hypothetical protein